MVDQHCSLTGNSFKNDTHKYTLLSYKMSNKTDNKPIKTFFIDKCNVSYRVNVLEGMDVLKWNHVSPMCTVIKCLSLKYY